MIRKWFFGSSYYKQFILHVGKSLFGSVALIVILNIRRCCRFLEHVDNAYFADESERARMKAEARVWRAWYHIRLLN